MLCNITKPHAKQGRGGKGGRQKSINIKDKMFLRIKAKYNIGKHEQMLSILVFMLQIQLQRVYNACIKLMHDN